MERRHTCQWFACPGRGGSRGGRCRGCFYRSKLPGCSYLHGGKSLQNYSRLLPKLPTLAKLSLTVCLARNTAMVSHRRELNPQTKVGSTWISRAVPSNIPDLQSPTLAPFSKSVTTKSEGFLTLFLSPGKEERRRKKRGIRNEKGTTETERMKENLKGDLM